MNILRSVSLSILTLGLLSLGAFAGTVTVTSGPNLQPPGAFTNSTIQAADPASDLADLTGSATITVPGSNTVSINMSGTYSADVGDLTTVAYTFSVDANVTGNTTYEINGSANPTVTLDAPGGGHFAETGTILPGEHVYSMAISPPGPMQNATSGTFNLTLTFDFNAAAQDLSATGLSAVAPGTVSVTISGIEFQVATTAAVPPAPVATPAPTPTPSPSAEPTRTPKPSPTPATALLENLSTRADIQTGPTS